MKMKSNSAGHIEASGDSRVWVGDLREHHNYNRNGGGDNNGVHHHHYHHYNGNGSCLQSLGFGAIDARCQHIAPAHPDTCDWLFGTTEFQKWRDPAYLHIHNGVFWIKGKPGAGKSTLMKHALSRYRDDFFRGHLIVAYFFNAQGETLEKTPLGMLRAIVYQLLKNDDTLYECFVPSFREKQRINQEGNWQWRQSELQEFILFVAKQSRSRPLLLHVDALDECDKSEVRAVVNFFESLSIHAFPNNGSLRICLSSRHYPSIQMKKALELTVEKNPDHETDIAKYIEEMLRVSDAEMEAEIRKRAEGVFLWVVMVVSLLNKAYDEGRTEAMRKTLQDIPDDLERMFSTTLSKDASDMAETVHMLQWVLLSLRPLKPHELVAAVVRIALPTIDVIRRRITTSSKGLVEIRQGEPASVQFIHLSVSDFLYRQKRLQILDPTLGSEPVRASHGRLWARCWSCIEQVDTTSTSVQHMRKLKDKDPFLDYAASHILNHAERAMSRDVRERDDKWEREGHADSSDISQRMSIKKWLQKPDLWFQWWKLFHAATSPSDKESELVGEDNAGLSYVLALHGLLNLLRVILENGADTDVNILGGSFGNALQAASARGYYRIVQLLLEKGADVNTQGGAHGNALQAASAIGDFKIVELLLKKGANVNAQGGPYGNALQVALVRRHYNIFQLLLENGANVNAKGGVCGNALQAASIIQSLETVQLLVEKDANINAQGGPYNTALQAASFGGCYKIVRLLIQNGADVNIQGGLCSHALQAASSKGHYRTVRLLLEKGANVNAQGGRYGNALQAAISNKHKRIAGLLREKGAVPQPRKRQKLTLPSILDAGRKQTDKRPRSSEDARNRSSHRSPNMALRDNQRRRGPSSHVVVDNGTGAHIQAPEPTTPISQLHQDHRQRRSNISTGQTQTQGHRN
ncbi:hypothetical protein J7T55_007999 [Diaporthe amygdali]|uniref:uncharacterized protein n=1 Tax=Phomopsis amygdali TaxID=1214568 RepID=UPI0022FE01F5|nr:uncharacterized protein J7T55_007999 [Diaporthe amygdali]KAJ0114164.1 hypothetical protein J7T55_007999 [Diaporthe amygdali]